MRKRARADVNILGRLRKVYENKLVELHTKMGMSTGQIGLAEYVLHNHKDEMTKRLESLLEAIVRREYDTLAELLAVPAEDIATKVQDILKK